MNAYLSSTTLLETPANLFGAAPSASGEWGGGALASVVATAALVALCVAARALGRSVERRRERRRERKQALKRREQEARAAIRADFLKNNGNSVVYATACDGAERGEERKRAERRDEWRRERRNGRRERLERSEKRATSARRRRQAQTRRAALRCAAFWTLIATCVFTVAPWAPTQNAPKKDERDDKTTVANRAWNASNAAIREVADDEGSRWENATALQNSENKRVETTGKNAQEKKIEGNSASTSFDQDVENDADNENREERKTGENATSSTRSTFAADDAAETRLIVACRAASETVDETPEARWVKTSSGQLTNVELIRAESSLEAPPVSSLNSAYSANWGAAQTLQTGATNERVSAENVAWRRRVAQPAQNLATAQSGQVSQFAQPTQNLATAQSGQVSQFAQPAQNLATAQSGQVSQLGNQAARGAAVASTYVERLDRFAENELAREFTPSDPLIPFPSEERVAPIASVSYEPRVSNEPATLLEQIDAEFMRIGARVQKSALAIETLKRAKTKSTKSSVETGCGFLFQYKDKIYLATNRHVVKDATTNKNVKIFLPDRTSIHPTKIMTCADFDLAALELDAATLPTDGSVALCFFGNSDDLRVSNFVGTVGNPFGLRDTVTYGHVSSLQRRKNDFTTEGDQSLLEFIQIDASINPGNSGGPLYNARGEVVGVVAAIATTTGKSEGVAFAIPINLALSVLKSTIDAGGWSRSHMGVELETASRADFQGVVDWPFKSGSKIVGVNANSPAERAGLRRGDVVVEFDGEAIEDDVHFARLIAIADVSRDANVKFLRGARLLETSARLVRSGAK